MKTAGITKSIDRCCHSRQVAGCCCWCKFLLHAGEVVGICSRAQSNSEIRGCSLFKSRLLTETPLSTLVSRRKTRTSSEQSRHGLNCYSSEKNFENPFDGAPLCVLSGSALSSEFCSSPLFAGSWVCQVQNYTRECSNCEHGRCCSVRAD